MKKIIYITLISLTTIVACSRYELIPDEQMQAIVTEALISDAIVNRAVTTSSYEQRKELDSLDIYVPILDKYDYTLMDFRYTVEQMAMRKSNPLDNIFQNVAAEIERMDAIASERYDRIMRYDSLVLSRYADTLYIKRKAIVGSLAKYKIEITPAQVGKYVVSFDYTSMTGALDVSKSFKYDATGGKKRKQTSTSWMTKKKQLENFRIEIVLNEKYDSLTMKFVETFTANQEYKIKDTTEISNIAVVWYPEISKARAAYFQQATGLIPSIRAEYEKQHPNLSDSITIPFERGWHPESKYTIRVRPAGDPKVYIFGN